VKRIAISALAAAIAALFLIVGASGFTAANAAPTVSAGQFCAHHDRGDTKTATNGDTVRCQKVGHVWKWVKVVAPSQSQSASASSSASTSASPSASAASSATASATPSATPNAVGAQLPLTGASVPLLILGGLVAAILGAGLFYATRRKTRFTA
jgi:LPXTG-motif cell wall-anchored protein